MNGLFLFKSLNIAFNKSLSIAFKSLNIAFNKKVKI